VPRDFPYGFDEVTRVMWDHDALKLARLLRADGSVDLARRIEEAAVPLPEPKEFRLEPQDIEQIREVLHGVPPGQLPLALQDLKGWLEQPPTQDDERSH